MKEEVPGCERQNDLVDFLYGELEANDAAAFERHLQACSVCSEELAGFKSVRASVVAWRNESLGGSISPALAPAHDVIARRNPSAWAALREFFNLSPLWMKGATVFASWLFCLFAVLAIAHWRERPAPNVVVNPDAKYTEQQLEALVNQRVREQLARQKNEVPIPELVVAKTPTVAPTTKSVKRQDKNAPQAIRASRPLTKTEREQLAADLRLGSLVTDMEIDLLEDKINE